jgi:hypothetical protein
VEAWFLYGGIALCLFALWAIARHDWLRLTRPSRRVLAEVVGHHVVDDGDGRSFAARYRFHDGLGEQMVTDPVALNSPRPPIGTIVELAYPDGYPELARPPRTLTWLLIYAGLLYGMGVLAAKSLGFI